MAKKAEKAQGQASSWCCSWKEVAYFVGAVLFAALGTAFLVEGLLVQWNLGFRAGFISYLLAFLFIGIAKCCKMNSCLGNNCR